MMAVDVSQVSRWGDRRGALPLLAQLVALLGSAQGHCQVPVDTTGVWCAAAFAPLLAVHSSHLATDTEARHPGDAGPATRGWPLERGTPVMKWWRMGTSSRLGKGAIFMLWGCRV